MHASSESDALVEVIGDVDERLPDVLPDVEPVRDTAQLVVDVYLGAVTQAVVRREDLKHLPADRFEAFRGNRCVDDAHASAGEYRQQREALDERLEPEAHFPRVRDKNRQRTTAVVPILIWCASAYRQHGLRVYAGARYAPPKTRRCAPRIAQRYEVLELDDDLDGHAEPGATVETGDVVRARQTLTKRERQGSRNYFVHDLPGRVSIQ